MPRRRKARWAKRRRFPGRGKRKGTGAMPCLRRYRVWAALFAVGAGLFGGAVAYVAADIPYLDVAEPSLRSRADGVLLGLLLISSWIAAGLAVAGAAATAWVHRRARRRRAEGGG